MQQSPAETWFDGQTANLEQVTEMASSITHPALAQVANAFQKNISDQVEVLIMPIVLLSIGHGEAVRLALAAKAMVAVKGYGHYSTSPEVRNKIDAEVQRLWEVEVVQGEKYSPTKSALEELKQMMAKGFLSDSIRSLFAAGISMGWTAFECCAQDAWTAALNSDVQRFAQRAWSAIPSESQTDGLSSKSIQVGMLARYGYDLRNVVGTLLAPKFDFTGVSGIRKAYSSAFGDISPIETRLASPELSLLEATRHLIVHRAGLVDDAFLSRTGLVLTVGQPVPLDTAIVTRLVDPAIDAGCAILSFLDSLLSQV